MDAGLKVFSDNYDGPEGLSEDDKTVLVLILGGSTIGCVFLVPAIFATLSTTSSSGSLVQYWIMSCLGFFCALAGLIYAVL